jgi:hypothetical protein
VAQEFLATREVCPACLPESGLGLLGHESEDTISHARLPHSEVGWDPSRGDLRFEKMVAALAPKQL